MKFRHRGEEGVLSLEPRKPGLRAVRDDERLAKGPWRVNQLHGLTKTDIRKLKPKFEFRVCAVFRPNLAPRPL